jgi:signal transduction histidine kinase
MIKSFSSNLLSGRILVFIAGCFFCIVTLPCFTCRAEETSDDSVILPITNVAQISWLSSQNPHKAYSISLEGIILWANSSEDKFVLQDTSGAVELEMDLHGQVLQPGQRIRLQGKATITSRGAGFQLGTVGPLVDDDGIHTMTEKSGSVYLYPGKHPLCVDWFNSLEKYGLEIDYQGPGILRQKIPDAALFRRQTNANGAINFVPGLNYACYPVGGEILPEFNHLAALQTGVVSNFDLSVIVQSDHVGLEFDGYLQVPREGLYTFYLTSDDGSRMFLGEQPLRLDVIGMTGLPEPRPKDIGQVLNELKNYERVKVEGNVTFVSNGKDGWNLELSSETGRLQLQIADGSGLSATGLLNSHVQAIGVCQGAYDTDGQKAGGIVLVSSARDLKILEAKEPVNQGNDGGKLPTLTTAAQVHELSREEAQRGYPVKIQGIITCVLPERQAFTVQDATRGIYVVDSSESRSVSPKIGEYLEIAGKTDPSLFAPVVIANSVKDLGTGYVPQPIQPTWDRLMNGSLDAQYIELQGVVTSIDTNGLTLFTGDGRLKVELLVVGMKTSDLERYEDAVIRVRGCLFASWDYVTHLVKVGDIRLYGAEISLEQPAPANMFSLPVKTVSELLQFNPQASVFQRVKVSGVIVYAQGQDYYLTDGKNGLQFVLEKNTNLKPGDNVEVVGFPVLNGLSPVLQVAVARKIGEATIPEAETLPPENLIRGEYDSSRVKIDGLLEGVRETPAGQILEIQSGGRIFAARLSVPDDSVRSLSPGSKLELTGVYVGEGGNRALGQDITSFELLLGSPTDIKILAQPPWWTLERLLVITGGLVFVLAAAALWITQLHRQVEQRTMELGAQIQQRQNVEHQRAMEQERTRIAQDLHDELGSGITEISMLIARAKFVTIPNEKKNQYLELVREKAGEMVTALDEIVWAMNPRHDSLASVVSYFCIYADRFLGLASLTWQLESTVGTTNRMMDSRCRHQLFLAFKEALTNVVRHAGASEVRLSISVEKNQLSLTVSDNGCGFSSAAPTVAMDGIANMRARIEKLGGRFEISGAAGSGTTVRFYVPLNS